MLTCAQGGYADGATLQFTVAGNDTNGDGFLEFENVDPVDEISDFSLTFSDNALIAPFSLGANDLLVFYLNVATLDVLDPDAIIFAGVNMVAYVGGGSTGADRIRVFLCDVVAAFDVDLATRPLTRIAEPSGLALLGLALPVMTMLRRRIGEGADPARQGCGLSPTTQARTRPERRQTRACSRRTEHTTRRPRQGQWRWTSRTPQARGQNLVVAASPINLRRRNIAPAPS